MSVQVATLVLSTRSVIDSLPAVPRARTTTVELLCALATVANPIVNRSASVITHADRFLVTGASMSLVSLVG